MLVYLTGLLRVDGLLYEESGCDPNSSNYKHINRILSDSEHTHTHTEFTQFIPKEESPDG